MKLHSVIKSIIIIALFSFAVISSHAEIIPYLQTPTSTSIWVSWKTHVDGNSKVYYGTNEANLNMEATGTTDQLFDTGYSQDFFWHLVKLSGLQPNTKYYYKVETGSDVSEVYSFMTQPTEGTNSGKYRVLVLGDHQIVNEKRFKKLTDAAKRKIQELYGQNIEEHINLVVHVGDQVDLGNLTHWDEIHFDQTENISPYLPQMLLIGNHETYGNTYQGGPRQSYYDLFVLDDNVGYKGIMSNTEEYYSFQVANIVFLMMSTEYPYLNTTQLAWATNIINEANNDNNIDWIISDGHRPIYAEQYYNDVSPWVRDNIIPKLVETEKAALHIGAHHHLYARGQERDYPLYNIISGGTAWNQAWGMSNELDHDNVQKTICEWAYQIIEFDLDTKEMHVNTYSVGNWVEEFDNKHIDYFYRKQGKSGPNKPEITNEFAEAITLPFTFESSAYATDNGEPYNSVQFQIASDDQFANLEFDLIRDFENMYGNETGTPTDIEDRNEGVDIFKQTIENNKLYNGTHFVRVRHRDKNIMWSEWSEAKEFEVTGSLDGEPELSVDKKSYNLSEDIVINFKNAPGNQKDWIGIYPKDINPGDQASEDWTYINGQSAGQVILNIPTTGEFYAVLLENDGYTELGDRVYFYVGMIPNVTTDKEKYDIGDDIVVNFDNAPSLTSDWIGIYRVGHTPGQEYSTDWAYVSGESGTTTLGPLEKGYYFVNYFLQDAYFEPGERVRIQVGEQISTISLNKTEFEIDENIVIFFDNGAGTDKDWMGIFKAGDDPKQDPLVQYVYVDGRVSGDVSFSSDITVGEPGSLPGEPGEYFVAFFINDSYDEISNRVYFTIKSDEDEGAITDDPKEDRFGIDYVDYMAPFYHGVASGDPQADRVMIWTRVTPNGEYGLYWKDEIAVSGTEQEVDFPSEIEVNWHVFKDVNLTQHVQSGTYTTNEDRDWTVKVDVMGLEPGTTYYYVFEYDGRWSIIGRTMTTPANELDRVKLAVITCPNWQWGHFSAYSRIAERNDLSAWVIMGDYYYEYAPGTYQNPSIENRDHFPANEIITLADYRGRHYQYKMDKGSRDIHQQLPMINTWDDHEVTNDSWMNGAENHDENEGDYNTRVGNSLKAYYEWMPMRHQNMENDPQGRKIYRTISYGNLVDLFVLETRLSGRMEQLQPKGGESEIDLNEYFDPNRTMLGEGQLNWLLDEMTNSDAHWKGIVSSIMMTQLYGFGPTVELVPGLVIPGIGNLDGWDGYIAERHKIYNAVASNNIENFLVISGDFHMGFASHLTGNPLNFPFDPTNPMAPNPWPLFDGTTGAGALGVEFTTPSISAANLNEQTAPFNGIPVFGLPERHPIALAVEAEAQAGNPQNYYANSDQHGYMVVDFTKEKVQTDFFFVTNDKAATDPLRAAHPVLDRTETEMFGKGVYSLSGENRLMTTPRPSDKIQNSAPLAPPYPPIMFGNVQTQYVCFGAQNVMLGDFGMEMLEVQGGTQDFDYSWYPAYGLDDATKMHPVINNISADRTYTLTVTDRMSGMTKDYTLRVEVRDISDVEVPRLIRIAKNGSVDLASLIINGAEGFTYNWSDKKGWTQTLANSESYDFDPASRIARLYMTAVDVNGCELPEKRVIVIEDSRKDGFTIEDVATGANGEAVMISYPNPAIESINILADFNKKGKLKVSIVDLSGNKLIEFDRNNTNTIDEVINVANLTSGTYMIIVESNEDTVVQKFVKQ